jgi:hypothetical protein
MERYGGSFLVVQRGEADSTMVDSAFTIGFRRHAIPFLGGRAGPSPPPHADAPECSALLCPLMERNGIAVCLNGRLCKPGCAATEYEHAFLDTDMSYARRDRIGPLLPPSAAYRVPVPLMRQQCS